MMPYVLIAAAVLAVIAAAIYWVIPHKTAELTVTNVELFAPHTEFKAAPGAGHLIGAPGEVEDDLYVVATLRMTDKLRTPLFFDGMGATMVNNDAAYELTTVRPTDLPRLEESFPQIAKLAPKPFSEDDLQPGETREGQVVVLVPSATADQWKQKKSATLTVRLHRQDAQMVALP
ncbi:MAG: hypothetical protein V4555_14780 [Acidobacteriota bacterium]